MIARLSFSGGKTEKPACDAKSAKKLWMTISGGMTGISSPYSEKTWQPSKMKRGGNILLA
jgi:hypothetical protein